MRIDVLVLIVAVVVFVAVVPGHGVWGYILAFVAIALLAAIVGLLGRRYPQIYGKRPPRRGSG